MGAGDYRLDGTNRMRERPIADLVSALQALGSQVATETDSGCPPVVLKADGLEGGTANVSGGDLKPVPVLPCCWRPPMRGSQWNWWSTENLSRKPYVEMTLAVMRAFGVSVDRSVGHYRVPAGAYVGIEYEIEPDASAASYFFAAAAITGGRVTVEGLTRRSLQGDVLFVDALEAMGCTVEEDDYGLTVQGGPLRGADLDMNAISDTAQTLSAVAVFADGPTTIRHIAHVRHKETDRISAVATELRRLGQEVTEFADGLTITPREVQPAVIQTYDDHRMAMSFALVGLKSEGIQIADPGCTAKTYPGFWARPAPVAGRLSRAKIPHRLKIATCLQA